MKAVARLAGREGLMIAIVGFLSVPFVLLPLAFSWRLWRLNQPTRLGWLPVLAKPSCWSA
ncbi:hypothetical protein BBX50_04775 [Ensifer sp. LC11]|nr:hypothetical protein BBX50_04775 [Ensifer sp. LC11]